MLSQDEIRQWLVEEIATISMIEEEEIDPNAPFSSYGLSSKDAISMSGDLEDLLDRRLSPTLVYEYPSIEALSLHLSKDGIDDETPTSTETDSNEESSSSVDYIEEMTDEEAEEILLEKLNSISTE